MDALNLAEARLGAVASLLDVPLEALEVCMDDVVQGKDDESVEATLGRIRRVLGLPIPPITWGLKDYLDEGQRHLRPNMGRNFGERARKGIPPPPGSPTAWEIGCVCPQDRNRELHGAPSNARWEIHMVAARCPVHGWEPGPPPTPFRRDEVLTILRGVLPELRRRFKVIDLWLFEDIARDEANRDSEVFLTATFAQESTLDEFSACQNLLVGLFGCRVELGEEDLLKDAVRARVFAERIKLE